MWDVESGGEDADAESLVSEEDTVGDDGGKKKKKVQPVVQAGFGEGEARRDGSAGRRTRRDRVGRFALDQLC
jgi:hypothetical protein